jgi:hypothetical protein
MTIDRIALVRRSGGRCECTSLRCTPHLFMRCPNLLGNDWQVHHIDRSKGDELSNLLALCRICHEKTATYGKPLS